VRDNQLLWADGVYSIENHVLEKHALAFDSKVMIQKQFPAELTVYFKSAGDAVDYSPAVVRYFAVVVSLILKFQGGDFQSSSNLSLDNLCGFKE
jgi:hypothetical protein